jgi:uroporphyrinogen decarboxylase
MGMNNRERFNCVMNFEKPDEFPLMEFMGFWPETVAAWSRLPNVKGQDLNEHFGLIEQKVVPINFNFIPAFEKKILEQTENYILLIDECGCTKKIENRENCSSMPQYIDFPIKSRRDFEEIKERMDGADHLRRYPANWDTMAAKYSNRDYPLGAVIRGPFAFCRDFMNFEHLMMLAYDEPELIKDMMCFQTDFTIKLWDKLLRDVELDFVFFGEDMAYKNGPMFSPVMLNNLLKPLYKKLIGFVKGNGIKNVILDSDGNVNSLLELFADSGVTCIQPIERTAGMDPEEIRKKYPRLQMIGGIDKLNIAKGKKGIEEEMKKVKAIIGKSGWLPCFDHSVPPIISYENYKLYVESLREAVN